MNFRVMDLFTNQMLATGYDKPLLMLFIPLQMLLCHHADRQTISQRTCSPYLCLGSVLSSNCIALTCGLIKSNASIERRAHGCGSDGGRLFATFAPAPNSACVRPAIAAQALQVGVLQLPGLSARTKESKLTTACALGPPLHVTRLPKVAHVPASTEPTTHEVVPESLHGTSQQVRAVG